MYSYVVEYKSVDWEVEEVFMYGVVNVYDGKGWCDCLKWCMLDI